VALNINHQNINIT